MDDKRLDKLLSGLKDDYDRLPDLSNNQNIVPRLGNERKRRNRGKIFSYVALIAGVFLFLILALPTFSDYQQSDVSSGYLQTYYEQKKEEFRKRLGIESVDEFLETGRVKYDVGNFSESLSVEEIEQVKQFIDEMFMTPSQIIEELNVGKRDLTEENIRLLISKIGDFSWALDGYFSKLKVDYSLNQVEQEELYENQYNYYGHNDLVEFMDMLHREGYQIINSNFTNGVQFQIGANYSEIAGRLESWEDFEGVRAFLLFMDESFDTKNPGLGNMHGIEWVEFDDILIEFEEIYHTYPEHRDLIFYETYALYSAQAYLNDYLSIVRHDTSLPKSQESLEEELVSFIDNHPDSYYTPIVVEALETYREDNTDYYPYYDSNLHLIFSLKEEGIDYDELIELKTWPISGETTTHFRKLKETKDRTAIADLSSFEYLSLYMYAAHVDDKIYEYLDNGEANVKEIDWVNIYKQVNFLMEETIDSNSVKYSFLSGATVIASVELNREDDGWMVSKQEAFNQLIVEE